MPRICLGVKPHIYFHGFLNKIEIFMKIQMVLLYKRDWSGQVGSDVRSSSPHIEVWYLFDIWSWCFIPLEGITLNVYESKYLRHTNQNCICCIRVNLQLAKPVALKAHRWWFFGCFFFFNKSRARWLMFDHIKFYY